MFYTVQIEDANRGLQSKVKKDVREASWKLSISVLCLSVFNKRQNSWTDREQNFCYTSHDPRITKSCLQKFLISYNLENPRKKTNFKSAKNFIIVLSKINQQFIFEIEDMRW